MRRVLAAGLLAAAARAQGVPAAMHYAGRLDQAGAPVDGARDLTFRLYAAATGGSPVWSETHDAVAVGAGTFSVVLGETAPLDAVTLDGSVLWLEVVVEGTALAPRAPLRSVAYAVRAGTAGDADTLAGLAPDDFAEADHTHASAGDVASVVAGAGLAGGGDAGDVTLDIDFGAVPSCAAGSALRGFDANGAAICAEDLLATGGGGGDVTAVLAGDGLAGGADAGDAFVSIDFAAFGSCSGSDKVTGIDPATGAVVCGTDAGTAYTASAGVTIAGTDIRLDSTGCAAGDLWRWNGAAWSCDPDASTTYSGSSPIVVAAGTLSLSTTGCTAGEQWKWSGTSWNCLPDTDTNSGGTVTAITGGAGIALSPSPIVASGTIALSSAGCAAGDLHKFDGTTWICEADAGTVYAAGAGIDLVGSAFQLSTAGCAAGDVWKWDGASWSCDPDAGGVTSGDITGVAAGSGLAGGGASGDVTLSVDWAGIASCPGGSSLRGFDAAGAAVCEADDVAAGGGGGDITGVTAGAGLAGGATTGDAALAMDFAVFGSCTGTSKVTGVGAATGAVACAADVDTDAGGDITGVAAGTGLSGGGGSGAVAVSIADGGVTSSHILDGAVAFADWAQNGCSAGQVPKWNGTAWACAADADTDAGGTVTLVGTSSGLAGGPITTNGTVYVAANGVTSSLVADNAVTTADIADGSLAFADLAQNGCAGGEVPRWSGSAWGCGTDASSGGDISTVTAGSGLTGGGASGDVTLSIAAGGVTSAMIADGTILFSDWAQNGCAASQLPKWNGTAWACAADNDTDSGGDITAVLTTGALTGGASSGNVTIAIGTGGVGATEIASGTIAAADIADASVVTADLADNAVSGAAEMAAGAVGTPDVADGAVTTTDIANGAVLFADWAANGCASGQVPAWNGTAWACATDASNSGDVTAALAGTGLTGGGSSGDVTLGYSYLAFSACVGANKVYAIDAASGLVLCSADLQPTGDITGASAGAGLSGGGLTGGVTLSVNYANFGACTGTDRATGVSSSSGALTCAADVDTTWLPAQDPEGNTITTVDGGAAVRGRYSAITIGSDGLPIISYFDDGALDVRAAHCGDPGCTSGNILSLVDGSASDVGWYTSIAIGTDGLAIIAYGASGGAAMAAKCSTTDCSGAATITALGGATAQWTSVAVPPDGNPVISHYTSTGLDLRVVKCSNASCTAYSAWTPDTTGTVGEYSSIAIATDGFPIVSYWDGSNSDLKILDCGSAGCTSGNAITAPDTTGGYYTSVAVGNDGLAIISHGGAGYPLEVTKCNVGCTAASPTANIDTSSVYYASVTIDRDGLPVIAYFLGGTTLKVAHCGDASCSSGSVVATVASGLGASSGYSAITIGSDGLPIISFYDSSGAADLKVARCGNPYCIGNWVHR